MSILDLIDRARAAGSRVELDGNELLIEGPAGKLYEELVSHRDAIKRHLLGDPTEDAEVHKECVPPSDLKWRPFPVEALPECMRDLAREGAKGLDCDPVYLALPELATAASAIGNAARLRLKDSYFVPSTLWCVVVASPGSRKSPAWGYAVDPAKARENAKRQEYVMMLAKRDERIRDLAKGEKEPEKPIPVRWVIDDTTLEGLLVVHQENPRGLLLASDELSAWFASFNAYRASAKIGSDAARWNSIYSGTSITVDRKTDRQWISVPRPAISIAGSIQPGILRQCLTAEHRQSGLMSRFMFAMPPEPRGRWNDHDIRPATLEAYRKMIHGLRDLPMKIDSMGLPHSAIMDLKPEAKRLFVDFHDALAATRTETDSEDLKGIYGKYQELAARLALTIHLVRWASGERVSGELVDQDSMRSAIAIAEWACHEGSRIVAMLQESDEQRDANKLATVITRLGGTVSTRDVQQGCSRLKTSGAAESALSALAEAGRGEWLEVPPPRTGGHATRLFRLYQRANRLHSPTIPAENASSVDVDRVDDPISGPDPDPDSGDPPATPPVPDGVQDAAPGVCECGSHNFHDVPIHDGDFVRRDCSRCGRRRGYPDITIHELTADMAPF